MTTSTLMPHVITKGSEIVDTLAQHGHKVAADDLQNLIKNLSSGDTQILRETLQNIRERCDVRWLGDLYVQGMTLPQWWGLLEELKTAAGRALKTI